MTGSCREGEKFVALRLFGVGWLGVDDVEGVDVMNGGLHGKG